MHSHGTIKAVATALVTLHVAPDTEGLAASVVGALERLLAGMRVAVDAKRAGPGKGLVAGRANVTILRLGK